MFHGNAHVPEDVHKVAYVQDVGNVADDHFLLCKEDCADHLERLILRSLRDNLATEGVAAFNYKRCHMLCCYSSLAKDNSTDVLNFRHELNAELFEDGSPDPVLQVLDFLR